MYMGIGAGRGGMVLGGGRGTLLSSESKTSSQQLRFPAATKGQLPQQERFKDTKGEMIWGMCADRGSEGNSPKNAGDASEFSDSRAGWL